MITEKSCKTCKYYLQVKEHEGECRANEFEIKTLSCWEPKSPNTNTTMGAVELGLNLINKKLTRVESLILQILARNGEGTLPCEPPEGGVDG